MLESLKKKHYSSLEHLLNTIKPHLNYEIKLNQISKPIKKRFINFTIYLEHQLNLRTN